MSQLLASIWSALEAIADGDVRLAEAILLSAAEDAEEMGTANPPLLRPANGWPGERAWS